MTGSTSATEVTRVVAVSAAVVLPLLALTVRLARAEHLLPRVVREFPLTVAAFLLILTAAPEASRA